MERWSTSKDKEIKAGDIFVLIGEYIIKSQIDVEVGGSSIITLENYQQLVSNNKNGGAVVQNPTGKGTLKFIPEIENPGTIKFETNPEESSPTSESPIVLAEDNGFLIPPAIILPENEGNEGNVISGIEFNLEAIPESKVSGIKTAPNPENVDINNNIFINKGGTGSAIGITIFGSPESEENLKLDELKEQYKENNEFIGFEGENNKEVKIIEYISG